MAILEHAKEGKLWSVSPLQLEQLEQSEKSPETIINDIQIERYEMPIGMARRIAYCMAAMLVMSLSWAGLAPIDVVAKAPGQLRPYGKPKLVQSELNGKINLIAVREGVHVNKNDVLIGLDSSIYKNELEQRQLGVQQEEIKLQQLEQGRNALESILKAPTVLPAVLTDDGNVAQAVNDVYSNQKALEQARFDATDGSFAGASSTSLTGSAGRFTGDMTALSDMQNQLNLERTQKEKQIGLLHRQTTQEEGQKISKIAALRQQIASHNQMLAEENQALGIALEQERDYAKVLDIGVSQVQYLDSKQKVEDYRKRVMDEQATITNLQNDLQVAILDLPRWRLQSDSEVLSLQSAVIQTNNSLRDVQIRMRGDSKLYAQMQAQSNVAMERAKAVLASEIAQISTTDSVLQEKQSAAEESRHMLAKAMITAPMSGTVTGLSVRGAGEVVNSGQQLMQILPDQGQLVVEAYVNNADIGFVRKGQNVKLKLDAYPYQDFGVVQGTVQEIAPFPVVDKSRGEVYLVRIIPQGMQIKSHGRSMQLQDGLTAECDIILRRVSVLQALLRPLTGVNYMSIKGN